MKKWGIILEVGGGSNPEFESDVESWKSLEGMEDMEKRKSKVFGSPCGPMFPIHALP